MKKRIISLFGVGSISLAACAAEFTFTGDENASWSDPGSYSENSVPSAGDTVTIAKACVGLVNDSNIAFINTLGGIILKEQAELRFNVTGTYDFTPTARCYSDDSRTLLSKISKYGAGVINLTGGADSALSYHADLIVAEGELKLFADVTSGVSHTFNNVTVNKGATLTLPPFLCTTLISGQKFNMAGTIHCPYTSAIELKKGPYLQTGDTSGEVSGVLSGNMILRVGSASGVGHITLSGEANTHARTELYVIDKLANKGMISFAKYGAALSEPSSIGTDLAYTAAAPSYYRYIGLGETTAKSFTWGSTVSNYEPPIFDAGATGGLIFEDPGAWLFASTSRQNHDIVITGSNTTECAWNGRFTETKVSSSADAETASTYIIKRGTGTWRFGHNAKKNNQGVVAVEDGTLKFDSLAPAGTSCSIGLSSRLRGRASESDSANEVPYAILLGGESGANPIFEYSGSAAASCDTRPIGVKANATLANGTAYAFAFTNVFGVGLMDKVLTLAGDSITAENTLTTVTNACGTLSITKDGAGTWELKGVQDPNGEIFVKQGTLILNKEPAHYTWFRVNIPQSYMDYVVTHSNELNTAGGSRSPTYSRKVNLQEFALYDVDGNRLNLNLTTSTGVEAGVWTSTLEENCAALVNGTTDYATKSRILANIFDGKVNANGCEFTAHTFGSSAYMTQANPSYAASFVMRLADDVAEPVSFDWANVFTWPQSTRNAWYIPYALTIDASVDGINWRKINTRFTTEDTKQWGEGCDAMLAPTTTVANAWVSDNTVVSSGQVRPLSAGKGFALNAKTLTGGTNFDRVKSYGVAAGATLRVQAIGAATVSTSALKIDMCGQKEATSALIDGLSLTENGTLTLVNVPEDWSGPLPVTFQNSTGVANLANWNVSVNGRVRKSSRVVVQGNTIIYRESGFVLFIR